MAILLTLAGRKFTTSFTGGAVVQLNTDGTWSELVAGDTVAWRLKDFAFDGESVLFHIRADGFGTLNTPDRGELYRSTDQGATWTEVTPQDDPGTEEYANDIVKSADGTLWCITGETKAKDRTTDQQSRIYKSTDRGATWTLSLKITEVSFGVRPWPLFNIAAHPTNANIIVAEGTEMVGNNSRLWKTTDGGSTWSGASAPTFESPPVQRENTGGQKQHVFEYTAAGDLVYAGFFEIAADDLFILKSLNDGDAFNVYHTEVASQDYGAMFYESTLIYILHHKLVFEAPASIGQGQITEIADHNDSPFTGDHDFHGLSRYAIHGVDTLHLGCNVGGPSGVGTEDPSVFTRPADLSSDWVEHSAFANMDSDLGYRLYVAIDGLVGATTPDVETPRPPLPVEPPGGGGPIGEPGIGAPRIGEARKPREQRGIRGQRGLRGRRGFKAGPIGSRLPPAEPGEQIDKSAPDEYEEEPVRKWLTFGWLAAPMLEGIKTITLRDWGPTEGLWWEHGELFYAYDTPPVEGGRRLALLRVMQVPFIEFTASLKIIDYRKLGYAWAMANGLVSPSGRTALQVWEDLHSDPERLWLLRFQVQRIFEQGRKEQGTVNVGIPRRIQSN